MDARLLRYYNEELRYLRDAGAEFAAAFPKIAGRLGMESLEVSDPYVERLLEGCAFLAARIQLKQDAEFPRFANRLLELVYPGFLAPVPAMLVAQVVPAPGAAPDAAPELPAQSAIRAPANDLSPVPVEFRTAWPIPLVPLETSAAEYFLNVSELGLSAWRFPARPRAGVRLRLRVGGGGPVAALGLDRLQLFLGGARDVSLRLYELLQSGLVGILAGPPGRQGDGKRVFLPASAARPIGFDDEHAVLPVNARRQAGVRMLQEYFAFPDRFLFWELSGLGAALATVPGNEVELTLLFDRQAQGIEGLVEAANFATNCVPAVNLFHKHADRISLSEGQHEFHVVPDRGAPLAFEIYQLNQLSGTDAAGSERRFLPLFAPDHTVSPFEPGYYTAWREPRLPSEKAKREGPRSGYVGSEVFVALVDPREAPYPAGLRQLSVETLCTNRDLPLFIPSGSMASGFRIDSALQIDRVAVLAGPSRPYSTMRDGSTAWQFINLLSHNYLSLLDTPSGQAAATLRDLLARLPMSSEVVVRRQIESLQSVSSRPVVRRHPGGGRIAFSRGIEIQLTVDELGHEGGSATLFGAVMHHYLARHVSMNSFVETALHGLGRGQLARWTPQPGQRAVI